jgi:hypothetical protein
MLVAQLGGLLEGRVSEIRAYYILFLNNFLPPR